MSRVLVRCDVEVAAPARAVWDYVTDWPAQAEWIPLTRVEVVDRPHQVGGRIRAWTGLGPVGFWDPMTITTWADDLAEDGTGSARCEVVHTGRVVVGEAQFAVHALSPETARFEWWEHLRLPAGRVGGAGWRVAGRPVTAGLQAALRRMASQVERRHADATGPQSMR